MLSFLLWVGIIISRCDTYHCFRSCLHRNWNGIRIEHPKDLLLSSTWMVYHGLRRSSASKNLLFRNRFRAVKLSFNATLRSILVGLCKRGSNIRHESKKLHISSLVFTYWSAALHGDLFDWDWEPIKNCLDPRHLGGKLQIMTHPTLSSLSKRLGIIPLICGSVQL